MSKKSMDLWSATSIGVGAMIGAGIFALIGIAVKIAGTLAYLSFIIAGIIALLTTYSVSRLAVTFPSKGGRVEFLNQAFGKGGISGSLNILMWLGYMIVTSLYAKAFGEYGAALLGFAEKELWINIFSSGVVILFVAINFMGAKIVGKSELALVLFKVAVLILFGTIGLTEIESIDFGIDKEVNLGHVLLATGVIFMSYEGFGLVANTAEDIEEPEKNLPRGLYLSVIIVLFIYVMVTIAVIGNLNMQEILQAKEYVLAEAAKPILGSLGFTIMGLAALISTASAINATIYGPVHMAQQTAEAGQLPKVLEKPVFGHESGTALLIAGLLILLTSNLLSLDAIAETGSMIFLIIYTMVNIGNLKLSEKTNSRWGISLLAAAGTAFAFCTLFYYEWEKGSISVYVFMALVLLCIIYEWIHFKFIK